MQRGFKRVGEWESKDGIEERKVDSDPVYTIRFQ